MYVEDDAVTRKNLAQYLKSQCQTLYVAGDGREGLELYQKYKPDIVITDIEMPALNGLEMARSIRTDSLFTQIIIVTAYTKSEYLLEAVNLQLIQYLVKPISLDKITSVLELCERFLNRKITNNKKILAKDVCYDTYIKELIVGNQIISLSKYERSLLELLIRKYPAPISYEYIDAKIYEYGASKNAIKLLVSSLRDKIKKETIINVSGFGYKLNSMDDD